jgi:4-hydroxy-tetrahydrodipicolinate reductase
VVVDYTHPSAVLNNLNCYIDNNCEIVMGTTGIDSSEIAEVFKRGTNYAVIAPNMAKQIVAMQYALLEMSNRFPGSFSNYKLTVTESHQSNKADTSGTAKAVVSHLATLNGKNFNTEEIVMLRDKEAQLAFGVPDDALSGHAWHTYCLTSEDGSVAFELKHNVCGRRIYAEGTADAVSFLADVAAEKGKEKRLYNMIDVLESGKLTSDFN